MLDTMSMSSKKDLAPHLSFTEDQLPEIKNWKVGKKYTLEIDVEQVAMRQGEEYGESEGEVETTATFRVKKVKVVNSQDYSKMTGRKFRSERKKMAMNPGVELY